MKYLFFVPARGGSKAVPNKNLYPVAGNPLIHYTLESAAASKIPHDLVVSTDDKNIADYCLSHKSMPSVTRRPPSLEGKDCVIDEEIICYLINHVPNYLDAYSGIVVLQPTSPVRTGFMIDVAVTDYEVSGAVSAFTGSEVEGFIWKAANSTGDIDLGLHAPYLTRPARQEKLYRSFQEDGSIYITCPKELLKTHSRVGRDPHLILFPKWASYQFDSLSDLPLLELLLENIECLENSVN